MEIIYKYIILQIDIRIMCSAKIQLNVSQYNGFPQVDQK